jgi:hypothetical protein
MMVHRRYERVHHAKGATPERARTAVHGIALVDEVDRCENQRRFDDIHAVVTHLLHVTLLDENALRPSRLEFSDLPWGEGFFAAQLHATC